MAAMSRSSGKEQPAKGTRIGRIVMSLLLGMVVLIFVIAISFLLLQISGKNSLYSRADNGEMVSTLSEMAVALGGSLEAEAGEDWQEGDVRYEGVHYRYNPDILTFLFLGIDKMTEVQPVKDGIDGGQSDAIFLLTLNPHTKEVIVIGIPRDTMTTVYMYDENGIFLAERTIQLCLQHGYGDGAQVSCGRSVQAVSNLFYGLSINGYCAINMGAIPLLNDAVGGITLQALENMDFDGFHVQEGQELHLEGMDAYHYLHDRDTTSFNSAGRRLERQTQYLMKYAKAAMDAMAQDVSLVTSLYGTLSKYMVTDISLDEVSYLATQATGYSLREMRILEGETVEGERFEEFYPDEEALYRLILEVFYEVVG